MIVVLVCFAFGHTLSMYLISLVFWKILQRGILSPVNTGFPATDIFLMPVHIDVT